MHDCSSLWRGLGNEFRSEPKDTRFLLNRAGRDLFGFSCPIIPPNSSRRILELRFAESDGIYPKKRERLIASASRSFSWRCWKKLVSTSCSAKTGGDAGKHRSRDAMFPSLLRLGERTPISVSSGIDLRGRRAEVEPTEGVRPIRVQ